MSKVDLHPLTGERIGGLRRLWRRLPEPVRYKAWTLVGTKVRSTYEAHRLARPSEKRPQRDDAPLVVAGLFSTANGIGEAARATWRALHAAGLSPIAVDLSQHLALMDMACDIPCQAMPKDAEGTLILQLNGPETQAAIHHLGLRRGRAWHTIGYWAWELPNFPADWDKAFPYLSEIWTISEFSANALRQNSNAPNISIFPHAISPPQSLAVDREQFGWQQDAFVFLTMADSMSSLQRKNPFTTIEAFKQAFGEDSGHQLIVKTRNLQRDTAASRDLHDAISGSSNIKILDASLSNIKRWELLHAADAIVSLHRAEGFGFVLAEAMALGKPVIATRWSGNMDFTCDDTSFLVDCTHVPCEDNYGIYRDTQANWADICPEAAAQSLAMVASNASLRQSKAQAAKEKILGWASEARIGAEMASYLENLPRT